MEYELIAIPDVPLEAVPKFLGGFIWGMTAENHLTEIQACYQGGDLIYHELNFALSELHKSGWDNTTQAILEFGIIALQIP